MEPGRIFSTVVNLQVYENSNFLPAGTVVELEKIETYIIVGFKEQVYIFRIKEGPQEGKTLQLFISDNEAEKFLSPKSVNTFSIFRLVVAFFASGFTAITAGLVTGKDELVPIFFIVSFFSSSIYILAWEMFSKSSEKAKS